MVGIVINTTVQGYSCSTFLLTNKSRRHWKRKIRRILRGTNDGLTMCTVSGEWKGWSKREDRDTINGKAWSVGSVWAGGEGRSGAQAVRKYVVRLL